MSAILTAQPASYTGEAGQTPERHHSRCDNKPPLGRKPFCRTERPRSPESENLPTLLSAKELKHRFRRVRRPRVADYAYRYYDPFTGRWPSRDPIAESMALDINGLIGYPASDAPTFEEEGNECNFSSAKITKLDMKVDLSTTHTGSQSYVPVSMWIDWEIEGDYKGPKWVYSTCTRPTTQPKSDADHQGHIPWCDDGNCDFNAGNTQNIDVEFYFLSCECELNDDGSKTGNTVWVKKGYHDFRTVLGDDRGWFSSNWYWSLQAESPLSRIPPPYQQ